MEKNKEREIELAEKFAKVKDEFAGRTGALLWDLIHKEVPDLTSEEANDIEAHHKDFRWILMSWDLQQTAKEQGFLNDEHKGI